MEYNRMPDTNRGKWEEARELLNASRVDLLRFAEEEGHSEETQGARDQAVMLEAAIRILDSRYLLGDY